MLSIPPVCELVGPELTDTPEVLDPPEVVFAVASVSAADGPHPITPAAKAVRQGVGRTNRPIISKHSLGDGWCGPH